MVFAKQLYVGFRNVDSKEQSLLGFATKVDETQAYQKRKYTVDNWRDNKIEPVIIDNVPIFGFRIIDTVRRYSTGNKVFRVLDPRGFELEISAENLFDIISNCTITNGAIMQPMLWGNNIYLVSSSSNEYQEFLSPSVNAELKECAYYKNKLGNIIYRYEGKHWYNLLSVNLTGRGFHSDEKINITVNIERNSNNSVFVYSSWSQGEMPSLIIRNTKLKDLLLCPHAYVEDRMISYNIPIGRFINGGYAKLETSLTRWGKSIILYKTKDAAQEKYTKEFLFKTISDIGDWHERQYKEIVVKYMEDGWEV